MTLIEDAERAWRAAQKAASEARKTLAAKTSELATARRQIAAAMEAMRRDGADPALAGELAELRKVEEYLALAREGAEARLKEADEREREAARELKRLQDEARHLREVAIPAQAAAVQERRYYRDEAEKALARHEEAVKEAEGHLARLRERLVALTGEGDGGRSGPR